eukprot:3544410-Ditylum_brightwellii.AAC.2
MSTNRCPFSLNSKMPDDLHQRDLYAFFEVKLDPTVVDSLTTTHNIRKLNSNSIEQKTGVPEGIQQWNLFEAMLLGSPKQKWINHMNVVVVTNQNQLNFKKTLKKWLFNFMLADVSESILDWLHNLQKPKDMLAMVFAAKFKHFNSLVKYCPEVNGVDPDPLTEAEKITAFKKACPQSWVTGMVKVNLNFTNFNDLTTYYNGLKAVELKTNNHCNNNNRINKRKWNNNNNNNNNHHQNNNNNN